MISTYQTYFGTRNFGMGVDIRYTCSPGEMFYNGEREYWVPGHFDILWVEPRYIQGYDSEGEIVYLKQHKDIEPGWRSLLNAWAFRFVESEVMRTDCYLQEAMRRQA